MIQSICGRSKEANIDWFIFNLKCFNWWIVRYVNIHGDDAVSHVNLQRESSPTMASQTNEVHCSNFDHFNMSILTALANLRLQLIWDQATLNYISISWSLLDFILFFIFVFLINL